MTTTTTVWADHGAREVRHARLIDSHVTLCGLGVNLTRNFQRRPVADAQCRRCGLELNRIHANNERTKP